MDSVAGMLGLLSSFYWRLTQLLLRRRASPPDDAYSLESGAWQGDDPWYRESGAPEPRVEPAVYGTNWGYRTSAVDGSTMTFEGSALAVPRMTPLGVWQQGALYPQGHQHPQERPVHLAPPPQQATAGMAPQSSDIPLYYHRHNTPPRPRQVQPPAAMARPQGAVHQNQGMAPSHENGGGVPNRFAPPPFMVPGHHDAQGCYLLRPDLPPPPPPKYPLSRAAGESSPKAPPHHDRWGQPMGAHTHAAVRGNVTLPLAGMDVPLAATVVGVDDEHAPTADPLVTPAQVADLATTHALKRDDSGLCGGSRKQPGGLFWAPPGAPTVLLPPLAAEAGLAWPTDSNGAAWAAAVGAAVDGDGAWTPAQRDQWELVQQRCQAQPPAWVPQAGDYPAGVGHGYAGDALAAAGDELAAPPVDGLAAHVLAPHPAADGGWSPGVVAASRGHMSPQRAPWPGQPAWQGQADVLGQALPPSVQGQEQQQQQRQPPAEQGSPLCATDSALGAAGGMADPGAGAPSFAATEDKAAAPDAGPSHEATPAAATSPPGATPIATGRSADLFQGRALDGSSELSFVEIPFADIVFGPVVGEGAFGRVHAASWNGQAVAVKVLSGAVSCMLDARTVKEFRRELATMARLSPHANVLRMVGACSAANAPLALVSELCSNGSLWSLLHSPDVFLSWVQVLEMARGAAEGLAHLHACDPPILHRDLKSSNLLLDDNFQVKVADFGLSRVMAHAQTMTGGCGTFQWMAPEVLAHQRYSERADVYSFGILLWEMSTRQVPFDGMSGMQAAMAVMGRGLRPHLPPTTPAPLAALIRSCWDPIPLSRPVMPEIVARLAAMQAEVGKWG